MLEDKLANCCMPVFDSPKGASDKLAPVLCTSASSVPGLLLLCTACHVANQPLLAVMAQPACQLYPQP